MAFRFIWKTDTNKKTKHLGQNKMWVFIVADQRCSHVNGGALLPTFYWSFSHCWTWQLLCVLCFHSGCQHNFKRNGGSRSTRSGAWSVLFIYLFIYFLYWQLCVDNKQFSFLSTDDPSPNDEPEFQYYLNEGVYGPFAGKLTETLITTPSVHKVSVSLVLIQHLQTVIVGLNQDNLVIFDSPEHNPGFPSVQQQPVGSFWGWHGPDSGALPVARA